MFEEVLSFYDVAFTKDRVVNDVSWHPFWTGMCAVTYTSAANSDVYEGRKQIKVSNEKNLLLFS